MTVNQPARAPVITVTREDIGARMKSARALLGWNQFQFAEAMEEATGDSLWTHYRVSKYEVGKVDISAEVLAVIATVQHQPIEWYYTPANDPYSPAAISRVSSVGRATDL